jgi:hypothetical protein
MHTIKDWVNELENDYIFRKNLPKNKKEILFT